MTPAEHSGASGSRARRPAARRGRGDVAGRVHGHRSPDAGGRRTARRRAWRSRLLFAQGLHPAHQAVPRTRATTAPSPSHRGKASAPTSRPKKCSLLPSEGRQAGCHEALFTLGDKPELRYRVAREELDALGATSTHRLSRADGQARARANRPAAARQSRRHDGRGDCQASHRVDLARHHAGDGVGSVVGARRPAFRLARQDPGGCGCARSRTPASSPCRSRAAFSSASARRAPSASRRCWRCAICMTATAISRKSSSRISAPSPARAWRPPPSRRSTSICGPSPLRVCCLAPP